MLDTPSLFSCSCLIAMNQEEGKCNRNVKTKREETKTPQK